MADLRRPASIALSVVLLHLALVQPNHPGAATWGAFRLLPLELPVIALGLALARGRTAQVLAALFAALLTVMVAIKAADLASNAAFGRPFNPTLDLHLAPAAWRLASGSVGAPRAFAAAVALAVSVALFGAALAWAAWRLAILAPPRRARALLAIFLAGSVALVALDLSPGRADLPGAAFTTRVAWEHAQDAARARADLATFRAAAATDPLAASEPAAILPGLRGRDVLLIFVESYGRATIERPRYAAVTRPVLAGIEARLTANGLAMRSAFLASPVVGGQSWLAHATLLSGLKVDSQARYRALIASPRRTLIGLAKAAGWRTVAVMPAISLAWPEADWFGYDAALGAGDLGYAGPALDWVTMPDQFTLAALERKELSGADRPPVFAEIALISSHAPFTPVLPLLPWDALGDGTVFAALAGIGPSPEAVWGNPERLRDQFARALDYSLRAVGGFAERRAPTGPLIVVLGDHQPASLVSQDPTGRDVPIHVIGPPATIARLDAWGWTPGLLPAPDAPTWEMAAFRDRLLAAYGPRAGLCPGPLPGAIGC